MPSSSPSLLDRLFKRNLEKKADSLNIKQLMKDKSLLLSSVFLSSYYFGYLGYDDNDAMSKMSDFQAMYKDPIIYNALKLIVGDATNYSPVVKKKIWSIASDEGIQNLIDTMFQDTDLQTKIQQICSRMCLIGSAFIRLYYQQNNSEGGISYIEIEENLFRYLPIEINGVLIKWFDKYLNKFLEPFEVVPFKINEMVNYQNLDSYYNIKANVSQNEITRNTFKYGVSFFENVRRLWKQLKLLEDNMILTRMQRSASVRIFKVPLNEDVKPQDASDIIDYYSQLLNTDNRSISLADDMLKDNPAQIGFGTNIILPTVRGQDITMEKIEAETDVANIVDIDYFKQKFYAALGIPPVFLGIGEELPGSMGESALIRLEIQYARMVRTVQFELIKGVKNMVYYHLLSLGKGVNFEDFDVVMNIISTAEDEEYKNSMSTATDTLEKFVGIVNSLKELTTGMDEESYDSLMDYISQRMLSLNDFNFKNIIDHMRQEQPEKETDAGSDLGGGLADMGGGSSEMPTEPEAPEGLGAGLESPTNEEPNAPETESFKDGGVKISKNPFANRKASPFKKQNKPKFQRNNSPFNLVQTLSRVESTKRKKIIECIRDIDNTVFSRNIPKFSFNKDLQYVKESRNKSDKKILVEQVDRKLEKKDLKSYLSKCSGFDVAVFGFKFESKQINLTGSEFSKANDFVSDNLITFTESLYSIEDVMNKGRGDDVIVYKTEGKYYVNYSNGLNYFKAIVEDRKPNFVVIELKEKKK